MDFKENSALYYGYPEYSTSSKKKIENLEAKSTKWALGVMGIITIIAIIVC